MTIQELHERAANVLNLPFCTGGCGDCDSDGCDDKTRRSRSARRLTDLNILEPEVDKWCKERGYRWQVTSRPDLDEREVVIFDASDDRCYIAVDPDRATAILSALTAAWGEE